MAFLEACPTRPAPTSRLRLVPVEDEPFGGAGGRSGRRDDAGAVEHRQLLKLQGELAAAAEVQRELLPGVPPADLPFDVGAVWAPCSALGGDYYDFIPTPGGVAVAVGDVAGKGVGAALLMATLRASLRAQVEAGGGAAAIVRAVNARLARDARRGTFATLFFGILDRATLELAYCSAGHEPAALLSADGGGCRVLDVGGLPLGVDPDEVYEAGSVRLGAGDLLAVYTDGVTEARAAGGGMFGREAARSALGGLRHGAAQRVCDGLLAAVRGFAGGADQADDIAVAAVRVRGR